MTDQPTPERISAAEIRQEFDDLNAAINSIRHDLEILITAVSVMQQGIQHAATATPPASGPTATFMADSITLDYMDGKPVYKMRGGQYTKFGVRVWPEVLPLVGVDAAALKPGTNPIEPREVRVLLETKDDDNGTPRTTARKVTGKA